MKKTLSVLLAVLMLAALAAMAVPASAKELPAGFKKLEYVESDGTQYIDTGLYATSKTAVEVTFQVVDPTLAGKGGSAGITGIYYGGGTVAGRFQIAYSRTKDYITMGMGNLLVNTPDVIPKDTEKHTAVLDAVAGTFVFDGKQVGAMAPAELGFDDAEDKRVNILIGATNFSKTTEKVSSYGAGATKFFGVTIKNDGATVADFVPALRVSDNMAGMYDTVRDMFFENVLTEGVSFLAGPEVAPEAPETTPVAPETTPVAPETTPVAPETTPATPADPGTSAPTTGDAAVTVAVAAVIAAIGAAVILRKKEN